MHYQRIKAVEANSPRQLQMLVNDFLSKLEQAPISIKYDTSFIFYEDEQHPHPRFIAYISFIDKGDQ